MEPSRTLRGRETESRHLTNLLKSVRAGQSQVLVIRGKAGIGKTALLTFLIGRADGFQLIRAGGVESEMELPFAGLHQLCRPYIGRFGALPPPQRDALATALGRQTGGTPDRFLVGLAVLNLLANVAEEQPVLGVIDDAQWLDHASAQTLEFVARRLGSEAVGLVFATRDQSRRPQLGGLPELVASPLGGDAAAAVLDFAVPGRLDPGVRDRILDEAHGNPLALLELGRALSLEELTFGSTRAPPGDALDGLLEEAFLLRMAALPDESRQLLVLAAADPLGDVPLLWRAAEELGIGLEAIMAVEEAGLLELRDRVRFRHPLVRSAVYRTASSTQRRRAHEALAEVTDPAEDPDRLAWHRAHAAPGPDEGVAAELQRSADRAMARGGMAAAAACLEAAAAITPARDRRARRSLEAAQAKVAAGAFGDALTLLAAAEAGPMDERAAARVELLKAQVALYSNDGNEPLPMLLAAARRLEPIDRGLARATYLDALAAGLFTGRLVGASGVGMRQVAEAVREVPLPARPHKIDLLLHGIAGVQLKGYAAAAADLRTTVNAFAVDDMTLEETLRYTWLAACGAIFTWDDAHWDLLTQRHLDVVRRVGALSMLPLALHTRVTYLLLSGDVIGAELHVAEAEWVADITAGENSMIPYGPVCLAAMQGDVIRAEQWIQQAYEEIAARGEGGGLNQVGWFQAILYNGVGRYAEALKAAQLSTTEPLAFGAPKMALGELVEAAVRSGDEAVAAEALEQLLDLSVACGSDLALGVGTARDALLRKGRSAEDGYLEAMDMLGRTSIRTEHARTQLHYGEWLRREGRRSEARDQLRHAYEAFHAMGVNGFAERARQELVAVGENLDKAVAQRPALTPHETHIARLAAGGLTNQEIGAELYLSDRTVEWHLRKVFTKLGISTRRQLPETLLEAGERLRGSGGSAQLSASRTGSA